MQKCGWEMRGEKKHDWKTPRDTCLQWGDSDREKAKKGRSHFFFSLTFHVSKSQRKRQPLGDETECTIDSESVHQD